MLEKRVSTNGKIFAKLDSLIEWDKNPRTIKDEDFFRLKKQVARLGQYKPLFVSQDGTVVGGNMRLRTIRYLNENVLKWTERDNTPREIDRRGQFDEVWVSELAVGEEQFDGVTKYHAILDGKVETELFPSVEQMMIEYGISDNDPAGAYDQQALFTLLQPHQEFMPLPDYKLEVKPPIDLKQFTEGFGKKPEEKKGPDYKAQFQVVVECVDEAAQQEVYTRLKDQGLTCKVLTL